MKVSKDQIRIFELTFDKKFRKIFFEGASKILDEGFLGNHTYVRKFEKMFSNSAGSKYAIAVPNGTMAIELPLRAIGVKRKDVLIGTNTFIASGGVILIAKVFILYLFFNVVAI